MAIETMRTLGQLRDECNLLGLTVTISGKKERKEDFVIALRRHFLKELYGSNIPWALSRSLEFDCPMLCRRYQTLKPEEQQNLWSSDKYVAEKKIDGNRMLIFFDHATKTFDFFSRSNSVKDFLPISYKDKILNMVDKDFDYPESFIIDSEIISSNPNISTVLGKRGVLCATQLQSTSALLSLNSEDTLEIQKDSPFTFIVFDMLYLDKWMLDKPWISRRPDLKKVVSALQAANFNCNLNPSTTVNKREFYESIIEAGDEGVVFKNIDAPYKATTSRGRDGWIKLKRSIKDALNQDIDAWITGFTESDSDKGWSDLIGGFKFSVKMRKKDGTLVTHEIGRSSGISLELRTLATIKDDMGQPTLNPDFLGRVCTITGQGISARALRLSHCTLVQFRPDKLASGCEILDESELEALIV